MAQGYGGGGGGVGGELFVLLACGGVARRTPRAFAGGGVHEDAHDYGAVDKEMPAGARVA